MKKTLIALLALSGLASADFIWNGGAGTISAAQWATQSNWTLTGSDVGTWNGNVGPGAPGQASGTAGDKMYKAHIVIRDSITITPVLEGWFPTMSVENNSSVTAVFNKFQAATMSVSEGSTLDVTVNGDIKDGQNYTVNGTMILNATNDNELQAIRLTLGDNASFTLKNSNHTVTENSGGAFTLNAHLFGVADEISTRTLIHYDNASISGFDKITCNFGEGWTNVGDGEITGAYQYKLVNTDAGLTVKYMVPEPATAALSLLALAGLAARRRRK